ncbi:unnamed protein product [Pieris macdunnoughi]|uniref:JmjC domain-containing protein n=1 Tax=Pieris macdunnoughi TaxID=345717 RepID=A0A821UZI7_9NEOP|nr:unnamed protein product [Pieris macdunnoughi]
MSKSLEIREMIFAFMPKVVSSLDCVSELDQASYSVLEGFLQGNKSLKSRDSIVIIQGVIDYMYENINIGNWKNVRLFLRQTITIATYLKLIALLDNYSELTDTAIKDLLETIDFGIMFGSLIHNEPQLLQKCASILNPFILQNDIFIENGNLNSKESISCTVIPEGVINIDLIKCPSMERFYTDYIMQEKPVILEECMTHWPALSKWTDSNYFIKLAGLRTISIEIGKEYTDSEWTQKLITMKEFIETYIYQNKGATGYLAQYPLFAQIPELHEDIIEPEYCSFAETDDGVNIMAWYGPKGTVSPLHHDPTKNLLAQVVGEKRIYLFSPKDSENLYPYDSELLDNTARVDPRSPDLNKYPKYQDAKAYYCVLKPGQMLFIPPKWWHFVESLSISFSVSFWWT